MGFNSVFKGLIIEVSQQEVIRAVVKIMFLYNFVHCYLLRDR